ncbi:2-oxoglutarate dehydrogenase E1 component [Paenibacillus baekrokdamisoli]|uniref:2-oxoglutarate dehydrogenase E1 component n=1 Tax=Paenibacillus baekrokdamisoli TaxID=1712516 RepID=A0A3G9IX98_9BACL|nr:2-oxoglutarate dehydrogenase E1 component [Paenibacillus baekrokdamisoli]MBB3069881.1 2-oxoglutarate dehydrogenase E1 component [Paenibacillus baekrokdamisoli]BBH20765.1 2-oxoglutarate dehydrogenase E1 component [Paenibacillus baekrokdamisoli]
MAADSNIAQSPWEHYYGPNLGYIQEMYEKYVENPDSVDPVYRETFAQWGAPPSVDDVNGVVVKPQPSSIQVEGSKMADPVFLKKIVDAGKLVRNIRAYGHLAVENDPLGIGTVPDTRLLKPETFNLTQEDLAAIPASLIWEEAPESIRDGWQAIQYLNDVYTKSFGIEYSHIHEQEERVWLKRQVESGMAAKPMNAKERSALLNRLIEVEQFETFLQRSFVGQKRFSIEGTDVLVPMLDEIVRELAHDGAEHILMGMAHRGRLNVLAHVLGKPYTGIFSEFHHAPNKDLIPSEGSSGINIGWTGDVKYHLGAHRSLKEGATIETRISLANNPSHLEYVNPIVQGFTRAAQDNRTAAGYPKADFGSAAAIIMHGDAAFAGEGIVAETLNFKKLPGYGSGGTIHIIVNNRLGFTTESSDSRSTYYASDLAKGYEIPIVHVSADDPEACIAVVRMACEYRQRFHKDFLIDMVGYRRHGHNETDDPETTQPLVYQKLRKHPVVSIIYSDKLKEKGLINEDQVAQMRQDNLTVLQTALDTVKESDQTHRKIEEPGRRRQKKELATAVPLKKLKSINEELLKWPNGFNVYEKLERILMRRAAALDEGGKVDWGLAETLAFATILEGGKPIRLSGQDSERATFAFRNLVLHDIKTGETYCPLHQIPQANASFAVYNSPLSEAAVLGFDYGYNVFSPETLVIWEAQYGDFANAAQVIIDQFITAGRVKWSQKSSIVMLLPHGYEGQGPEHSSARLERFLLLAAEDNWTVANLTSAAQYFHILRRQAAMTDTDEARPLIIMSPKSLIRNPLVASDPTDLSEGAFKPVLEQPGLGTKNAAVERLIFCSGKISIDLATALTAEEGANWDWLHIARIEQLYPFPKAEVENVINRFPNLKEILWVQEEPQNMGAWNFIEPRIRSRAPKGSAVRYVGRPKRSSPASGFQFIHNIEQQRIISVALNKSTLNTITQED